jgi:dihydroflavonol-4-reductase
MSNVSRKLLITGGNGFLGSRTAHEFSRAGYSLRILLREKSDTRRIADLAFDTAYGDVRNPESLRAAMDGCEAVIHLAGISAWHQIREFASELDEVIVEGTRNILEAAAQAKVRRVVFVSSAASYGGSSEPVVFTEDLDVSRTASTLPYARAKRRAEDVVNSFLKKSECEVVTVNPCEIYGPDDIGLVTAENLIGLLGPGAAFVVKGGTAVAHVDDVARGIRLAFENGRSGEKYFLGGDNLALAEIASVVRAIAGKSGRVITVPNWAVRSLNRAFIATRFPPAIPKDFFEYASRYWFVSTEKAKRELGYESRPAAEVFKEVVPWLVSSGKVSNDFSLRYGGGVFDIRSGLIRLFGLAQRKKVVILKSDPLLVGEVLAASDTKGSFLERLFATPAWEPIYSIESMDGERWDQLSRDFKELLSRLEWRSRLSGITLKYMGELKGSVEADSSRIVDSEFISRTVVRILYELLFRHPISGADETLFYRASLEWRKEIAIKGKADVRVKNEFWKRLQVIVQDSPFKDGLESYRADPACWLSLFAQPFLISPQINIGDIFVTVFRFLEADSVLDAKVIGWAGAKDRKRLEGVVLEAIRLRHPFPILEREMKKDFHFGNTHYPSGTQVFILLDQFEQDETFDAERWLKSSTENPYSSIPFAAGPRMCIGKPIAMELLVDVLSSLLNDLPRDRVRPESGHLYSGRSNDRVVSSKESRYQAKIFAKALWQSLKIGRSN